LPGILFPFFSTASNRAVCNSFIFIPLQTAPYPPSQTGYLPALPPRRSFIPSFEGSLAAFIKKEHLARSTRIFSGGSDALTKDAEIRLHAPLSISFYLQSKTYDLRLHPCLSA
jgi:hypothetical protein